jgi:hypothetical protein
MLHISLVVCLSYVLGLHLVLLPIGRMKKEGIKCFVSDGKTHVATLSSLILKCGF